MAILPVVVVKVGVDVVPVVTVEVGVPVVEVCLVVVDVVDGGCVVASETINQ